MNEEIEVYSQWRKEERQVFSVRCPICHDFALSDAAQYTRADGKVWLCEACWERVFGEGDD